MEEAVTAELCVAVPFHTTKNGYLEECLQSVRASQGVRLEVIGIDDRSQDGAREIAERYCDQIIDGPGLCNWRPGAIHWPVFQAWLTTKAPFVTYLFSDDRVDPQRFRCQVGDLQLLAKDSKNVAANYVSTWIIDQQGRRRQPILAPEPGPHLFGGIPTFTEGLVIDRQKFFDAGGLDFPIHVAAMAEAWIWAAAGAAGKVVRVNLMGPPQLLEFRQHPETISASGRARYFDAVQQTRFFEEDQWRLWRRIEPQFHELVRKAKLMNS